MAYISQDQNQTEETNTTNVLAPTATPTLPASQPATSTTSPVSTSAPSSGYVSTGNPYGKYGQPNQPQAGGGTSASARKSTTGPSSGLQTNVQTYAEKNQQSSQKLGQAVAGKLQNTSDVAKQNLQNVEKKFQQGIEAGSLENRQGAVTEAQGAFTEAANAAAPTRTWNERAASMYAPTKTAEGAYSAEDQALVDANKARATFGDGSYKDFGTQAEAQSEIDAYNKENPGFYTYGDQADLGVKDDRLSDILNAKYQGPQELSEIGGYGETYNKIQDVSQLQNQALGGGSKEELLKRTFQNPTTEYGKGNQLLDDLLLGQGNAAQTLRSTAEKLGAGPTGKVSDEFTTRVKEARGQAVQRGAEIEDVKQSARKALTETAANRDTEVNQRINDVVQNWEKYPQHFRDSFKQKLDLHNESSQKKAQYDTVAPQYQQAKAKVDYYNSDFGKSLDSMPDFDYNKFQTQMNLAYGLDSGSRNIDPAKQAEAQKYIRQYDSLLEKAGYGGVDSSYGGTYNAGYGTAIGVGEVLRNLKNEQSVMRQSRETLASLEPQYQQLSQYASYDPSSLNMELSQLEAEALGVKGGEGLYNLIQDQGIEGLLKTKAYDKNQLVSQQEQSQLARLQSIAEMAKDYGVEGSNVNVVNRYQDRDLAGQQNATSALDTDNFKRLMQGAERTFRTDAAASNISGTGSGSGSSRGLFGKKKASATQSVSQNFGDLLAQNNAYRNMYSDEGVDKNLLKQMAESSRGQQTFNSGNVDTGIVGGAMDAVSLPADMLSGLLGKSQSATNLAMLTNQITAPMALANILGSTFGGSSAAAQGEADRNAQAAAVENLKANIQNKIQSTGLKNQFSVKQNEASDLELFKLLGLLDTTNL
jgi:hypothetical protein